jgi:hypothetical protein
MNIPQQLLREINMVESGRYLGVEGTKLPPKIHPGVSPAISKDGLVSM